MKSVNSMISDFYILSMSVGMLEVTVVTGRAE